MLTHEQIDERTEIATPNRTMLHDQSRENERKSLQHSGTWKRDSVPKVAEMSQSIRLRRARPKPVPRLLVPLKHYYDLAYVCDNVNHRQKQTNLLRATTATCVLEIDAWPQQLQAKAHTWSKIMKIETSPIMSRLIQFFVFVFNEIFYRNKQIAKKQLEYLF